MSDDHRLIVDQAVGAGLDEVWDLISTSSGRAAWFGTRAEITLRVGGASRVDWGSDEAIDGTVRAVEPPRRLRIAYESDGAELGAEEYLLSHEDGVTHVRLIQSFERKAAEQMTSWDGWFGDLERGWRLFLESLAFAATDATTPRRHVDGCYLPTRNRDRPTAFAAVCSALGLPSQQVAAGAGAAMPGTDETGQVRLADPPASLLLTTPARALLVDLEGPPDKLVCYVQAAVHEDQDDPAWRTAILDQVAAALGD